MYFLQNCGTTTGKGVGQLRMARNTSGKFYVPSSTSSKADCAWYANTNSAGAHTHTVSTNASNTGGSAPGTSGPTINPSVSAHNNMQPYKAVYRWHRTR